jgi:hypothetical protein
VLKALPDYLGPVATVLAVVLAYYFGRRQTEYQRLYERRAEVIAGLFERYARMDQRYRSLIVITDKKELPPKTALAAESFEQLRQYHFANSIWLSRSTSRRLSSFTARYEEGFRALQNRVLQDPFSMFEDDAEIEWGQNWKEAIDKALEGDVDVGKFDRESLEIRGALEDEFRAALGDRRAKLARLWRIRLDARGGSRPGADGGGTAIRRKMEELGLRSSEEEAQEGVQRPWWRRMFGG